MSLQKEMFESLVARMDQSIDWRRILLAYIYHVGNEEGVTFIRDEETSSFLTEKENKALLIANHLQLDLTI